MTYLTDKEQMKINYKLFYLIISTQQLSQSDDLNLTLKKIQITTLSMDEKASLKEQEDEVIQQQKETEYGIFAPLLRFEHKVDRILGIESEALERKSPAQRGKGDAKQLLSIFALWASSNLGLVPVSSGMLGPKMGLDLRTSLACVFCASLVGSFLTAYLATFGPAMGMRQMTISRYSFGWWPNKVIALVNVLQQLGYSASGCITGGIALRAVSDGSISRAVGIVIIAVVALIVCFFGLRFVKIWELYAWVLSLIVLLIVIGETGYEADNHTRSLLSGTELSGAVLSLLSVTYAYNGSWCAVASDYYVDYPEDIKRWKVFLLTSVGLTVATSISMWAGALLGSTTLNDPRRKAIYEDGEIGSLFLDVMHPLGFAKALLVLLILSVISMNILSTYSAPISWQNIFKILQFIPRFFWTLCGFGIAIGIAMGGGKLDTYLEDFLSFLGYWCTSYFIIVTEEHVLFRKASFKRYDLDAWNDPKRLPHGIAAAIAFLLSVIFWAMGMANSVYVGPIAKKFGGNGGDVAVELTFVLSGILYPPLRALELYVFGK